MPQLINIYHQLPYPLKVIAASVRGYYLRWWRYGPEHKRLVAEALERDSWSAQQWSEWRGERLAYVLHRAATQVPHYREQWAERRRKGDNTSWNYLENWPILRKETLRSNPRSFIAEDKRSELWFEDRTSGTTGTPLSIFLNRDTLTKWFAIFEARVRKWYDVSIKDRWAILGGQMVTPFNRHQPPFWVFNAALNQLYLSTHHISPKTVRWYAQALWEHRPTHMIAYPSSASVLATYALEQNLRLPEFDVFFSNAEPLLEIQEKVISKAFNCSVVNTYGVGEYVVGASECRQSSMHLWPEVGFIEVLDNRADTQVDNETGRLVATGLLNSDMPLIRYEVGDRGRMLKDMKCECGRNLPVLGSVEGRINDLLLTEDGRQIFWVNPTFYGLPICEAQIIQENLKRVCVRYVPAPKFTKDDERSMVERLQARMGNVDIDLEQVDQVPRELNGKFRPVISQLSKDEIERATRHTMKV